MLHERFLFSGANVSRDASLNLNFVQFQSIENVPLSLFHDKCFVHMDTLHFVESKLNLHVRS